MIPDKERQDFGALKQQQTQDMRNSLFFTTLKPITLLKKVCGGEDVSFPHLAVQWEWFPKEAVLFYQSAGHGRRLMWQSAGVVTDAWDWLISTQLMSRFAHWAKPDDMKKSLKTLTCATWWRCLRKSSGVMKTPASRRNENISMKIWMWCTLMKISVLKKIMIIINYVHLY